MSKAVKIIAGAVLAVVGLVTGNLWLTEIGISMTLSGIQDVLTPKARLPGDPGVQQEYSTGVGGRRIIYGTMRTSGMNTIGPWTSGTNGEYLHQVLTLAGHEVNDITDVYFNQDQIASANIGSITGANTDGAVSSGTYTGVAWIRRYKGTTSQTVDYILTNAFPTQWDSNHRGREIAYLALRYKYDLTKYLNGAKPEVTAIVQGKKCYDPRLDSSPGANPTNPSYIAFTSNPALCLADYLTDLNIGCRYPTTRINWTKVVTAANICDENVLIPPASPATYQKRYTCNVILDCTAAREDNIKVLAGAMLGYAVYRNGKWDIDAGAWSSSAFSITDSDIIGTVKIGTQIAGREKFNAVSGMFIDASKNYTQGAFEPITNSTYESADGRRRWKEVQFAACTNQYEAQRAAIILNKLGRRAKTFNLECGMPAYKIRPFETGTLTISRYNLSGYVCRALGWTFTADGKVSLSVRDEASTDWSDPAVSDYAVPGSNTIPTPSGFTPSAPNNFTAVKIVDGILFSWTLPDLYLPGSTFDLYEYTSATPFASATLIASNLTGTSKTITKLDTTTRYYWLKCRAPNGVQGSQSPPGDGIPSSALTVTTGLRATISPGSLGKTGTTASLTTPSTTVTPAGGTPGYTYAWAYLSGDASITISSSTSATPTFTRAGMAFDDAFSGTWRCTVTDAASGTTTVDCALYFHRISTS